MVRAKPFLLLLVVGAVLGLLFAGVSTRDFSAHLDRQVHDVTCSFTLGVTGESSASSGCAATMTSPYSSVFRSKLWGGIPISLAAMGVFAFLLIFAGEAWLSGRYRSSKVTLLLALAAAVPVLTSLVMGTIAVTSLDTLCTICIGIYISSALTFAGAVGLHLQSRKLPAPTKKPGPVYQAAEEDEEGGDDPAFVGGTQKREGLRDTALATAAQEEQEELEAERKEDDAAPPTPGYLAGVIAVGIACVTTPMLGYAMAAPDQARFIGTCGRFAAPPEDDLLISLGDSGGVPAIEVLDPLCPACQQFEGALRETGLDTELKRSVLLFPLDKDCNWMLDNSMHPGACSVSEAVLCAKDPEEVLRWSFANQKAIASVATKSEDELRGMIGEAFPEVAGCLGSPEVKSRLNRSMRWTVANGLRVLTPQLFIDGVRLCDEDVDIGLAYTLSQMIDRSRAGTLKVKSSDDAARAEEVLGPEETAAEETAAEETAAEETAAEETAAEETAAEETASEEAVEETKPEPSPQGETAEEAGKPTGGKSSEIGTTPPAGDEKGAAADTRDGKQPAASQADAGVKTAASGKTSGEAEEETASAEDESDAPPASTDDSITPEALSEGDGEEETP